MNLPLPKSSDPGSHTTTASRNAGLWYDKFFNLWKPDFSGVADGDKAAWIESVSNAPCGDRALLSEAQDRLRYLTTTRNGQCLYFKTEGRFVTGLGRAHPVENGFAWHHTLGTPYLPGSSVKGLLRAWARETGVEKTDIERIFGPDTRKNAAVGSVIVLDAMPMSPVKLEGDVMTPHYSPYYQDPDGKTPPADWHSPKPIPFLTVADGQGFVFALLPRRAGKKQDDQDCATAAKWLVEALTWLGAGAKTSIGYGRFVIDTTMTEAAAEAARKQREARERQTALRERLQGLSPLAQALERDIVDHRWETDKNAFAQKGVIENWLDRLEADPQSDAIHSLGKMIRKHFPDLLDDPDAMHGKKGDKPNFKPRQRDIAYRFNVLDNTSHTGDST